MVIRWVTYLVLAVSTAFPAVAASVTVEANPASVYAGQQFLLTVTAVGKSVGEPQIPGIPGLQVAATPTQRADQYSMSTGAGMSVVKTRGYAAMAQEPGKIVIPPIPVTIDGNVVSSREVVLDVRPAQAPLPGHSAPQSSVPPRGDGLPDPSQWVFVTSDVNRNEVYVGEAVRLGYELWRIIHRSIETGTYPGASFAHPTTEGFYATEPQVQRLRRHHDGYDYEVMRYERMLYPTRAGTLTVGPWRWEGAGRVWAMFNADQHPFQLATEPITVEVKPLPPAPPDYRGGVGSYTLKAELSRTDTLQGVPVELHVRISGRGNPDAVGNPVFPALPDAFVAEPAVEVAQAVDEAGVAVEKRMTYAITPLEAGVLTVAPLVYTHFNPETGQYETKSAGPFTIQVKASAERGSTLVTAGGGPAGQVAILKEDIEPIITTPASLSSNGAGGWALGLWMVLPVAGYGLVTATMTRRRRLTTDTAYARSQYARQRALKRLREAPESVEPADEVGKAITGYLADRRNCSEAGMTASEAEALLVAVQAPAETREKVGRILQRCERSRYGGAGLSPQECRALADGAAAAVEELEAFFRKGGR